ncbi:hypothetical protein POM88_044600 [Heracleum sosnowskyi]|uniref:Uncharacterized protein n=1 Tax=Heracleum sosnowskyi TaxID=360622 RepID=A0AAD8H4C7_9APIA|nr:hypothetical protein POM88_044600 [Heracleum sosnowskyi]
MTQLEKKGMLPQGEDVLPKQIGNNPKLLRKRLRPMRRRMQGSRNLLAEQEAAKAQSQASGRVPIINLDPTPRRTKRAEAPRDDPSVLLPLGDPDDPTPPFTQDIMKASISRKFKMPTIKAYDGTGDPQIT